MNEGDFISGRLSEWNATLSEALAALAGSRGGMEAALAGRALEAAGHLLRRLERAQGRTRVEDVERLLRALPADALRRSVESVDPPAVEARIRRATDEAVEAALPEQKDDGQTWAAWAKEDLEARDALEALVVALRFREELGPQFEAEKPVRARLAAALEAQDRALSPRARRLVALNAWRRAMRDALDAEHRAGAWWYAARAECDDLLAVLAGEKPALGHVRDCEACRRDLLVASPIEAPRVRHLSEDDLWRFDLGVMSHAERAYADAHARRCAECARALSALAEAEEAVADPGDVTVVGARPRSISTAREQVRGAEPEVLAENAGFRLLLFRRREQVRLLVRPKREGLVAAASLELPGRMVAATFSPEGLVMEVPSSLIAHGVVRVRLAGDRGESTHAVDLGRRDA